MANSNPTVCINDLVQQRNLEHGCGLRPLGCEQLVARTLGCLEALIARFQQGGADAVLPDYYKRWLHRWAQHSRRTGEAGFRPLKPPAQAN